MIISLLEKNLDDISREYGCGTGFSHSEGYPPLINDKALYRDVLPVLENLPCGYEEMSDPLMISEDF